MPRSATGSPGRTRWFLDAQARAGSPLLDELITDPDAVLEGPRSFAREIAGRKRFYRLEDRDRRTCLYVKVFTLPRGLRRLRSIGRRSRARHELAVAERVNELGFRTALPVAIGEERHRGMLLRSFSVVPALDASDLRARLEALRSAPRERRALIESFARLARRLHDAGVDQDDFAPNNFLIGADGEIVLIDFERCQVGPPLGARRWKLLAKLHRHRLGVPFTDRLRFLRAYLGAAAGRDERRRAWERIERELWKVRKRDARHAARAAFQLGRHLTREGDAWVVRGREHVPVRRLALRPGEARRTWIRVHQLERLELPALRPVRLHPGAIELEDPGESPALSEPEREHRIRVARRRLEAHGHFTAPPDWRITAEGARLADPRSYRLRLCPAPSPPVAQRAGARAVNPGG